MFFLENIRRPDYHRYLYHMAAWIFFNVTLDTIIIIYSLTMVWQINQNSISLCFPEFIYNAAYNVIVIIEGIIVLGNDFFLVNGLSNSYIIL